MISPYLLYNNTFFLGEVGRIFAKFELKKSTVLLPFESALHAFQESSLFPTM